MTNSEQKNNLVEKCNLTTVCTRLQIRLESRALKGFFAVHSFDKDGKPVLHGVLYKQAAADEGEFISVCPFCGQRPGQIGVEKESAFEETLIFSESCPECGSVVTPYYNGRNDELGERCSGCSYKRKLF